ncbi:hypothetical protein BD560DRAFT_426544 [Blakeslea trispora]|nr:hypothetical protein BD560DRAFT_426544 [Blakeslea trispora]
MNINSVFKIGRLKTWCSLLITLLPDCSVISICSLSQVTAKTILCPDVKYEKLSELRFPLPKIKNVMRLSPVKVLLLFGICAVHNATLSGSLYQFHFYLPVNASLYILLSVCLIEISVSLLKLSEIYDLSTFSVLFTSIIIYK